jgi:hypothetical protein
VLPDRVHAFRQILVGNFTNFKFRPVAYLIYKYMYTVLYIAERIKRGAPEGRGASYLAGGGWSVYAQCAKDALRMPCTTFSCIDLYQK